MRELGKISTQDEFSATRWGRDKRKMEIQTSNLLRDFLNAVLDFFCGKIKIINESLLVTKNMS